MSSSHTKQQKEILPGGYHPIDNVRDARVMAAATFALQDLQSTNNSNTSIDKPPKYSFLKKLSNSNDSTSTNLVPVVVAGSQQVVAGMNYKLILAVYNNSHAVLLGGLEVTIYDRFGERSVAQWGKEVSQDKIKQLLETTTKQEYK